MNEKIEEYLKLSIPEIDKRIKVNVEILDRIWREDDGSSSWDEYQEKRKPYWDDNHFLLTAEVLLTPFEEINLSPMRDLDKKCRVPIKTFKEWCDCYAVTSYDGVGYYATKDKVSDLTASPRAFHEGYIRDDFKYVCWYNK